MMQFLQAALVFTLLLSLRLVAYDYNDRVIYGDDNRVDVYQAESFWVRAAASTAAMIPAHTLAKLPNEEFQLPTTPMSAGGICKDERFADQPNAAMCSGFLVGPDLLVTAGHCVTTEQDCKDNVWVFDYAYRSSPNDNVSVASSYNIFGCKKIIEHSLDQVTMNDFSLIQLDRPVVNRPALVIRLQGKIEDRADVVVVGHPTGLPTKVAGGANVRANLNPIYFQANLDTYGGNSGSAVFNAKTGIVEGILVRGDRDYRYDPIKQCRVSVLNTNEGGRGEDVTRITNLKTLQQIIKRFYLKSVI